MCSAVENQAVATIPWVAVVSRVTGRTIVAMEPLTVARTFEFRFAVVHIAAARIAVRTVVESTVVAANNSGCLFEVGRLLKHMRVDSWKGKGLAYCALPSCSPWAFEQPVVEDMDSVAETTIVVAVIADKRLVVASSMFGQWLVATDE